MAINEPEKTKKCPSCAEQVLQDAIKCKHCGTQIVRSLSFKNFLIFCLSIFIIFSSIFYSCYRILSSTKQSTAVTTKKNLTLNKSQSEFIRKLEKQGFLRIEPQYNAAYIATSLWDKMEVKTKEDLAAALAIYCANQKKSDLYWVEILDKFSGKRLAKYSSSWGFKID